MPQKRKYAALVTMSVPLIIATLEFGEKSLHIFDRLLAAAMDRR